MLGRVFNVHKAYVKKQWLLPGENVNVLKAYLYISQMCTVRNMCLFLGAEKNVSYEYYLKKRYLHCCVHVPQKAKNKCDFTTVLLY